MKFLSYNTIPKAALCCIMATAIVLSSVWAKNIEFHRENNVIQLTDFPENSPATIDDLLRWEKQANTGKIHYDPGSDTCRIDASLWIGNENIPETFFQLGRKNHSHECLIVKGDVWVRPAKIIKSGKYTILKRSDHRLPFINNFSIGSSEDPTIKATLMIHCKNKGQYGLRVGYRKGAKYKISGELHVYNSKITAAIQKTENMLAPSKLYGSDVRLINAELSWISGLMTYGLNCGNNTVEGTCFTDGGTALCNGVIFARNCEFRKLDCGILDYGNLDATLINCIFENNKYDWVLGGKVGKGIVMIDCVLHVNSKFSIRKNLSDPEKLKILKYPIYPICTQLKTLVVKVTDKNGKPIPNAIVNVLCDSLPSAVKNTPNITDLSGKTPCEYSDLPILITTKEITATDTPDQPVISENFKYKLIVAASGHKTSETHISANKINSPVIVFLNEQIK